MNHITRHLRPRAPRAGGAAGADDGYAMILVMTFVLVGTIMLVTLYDMTNSMTNQTRRGTDWSAAIAAADAGIDDYITRLTVDDNYWKYTCTSQPSVANPALCAATPVAIPGDDNGGTYSYSVDTSALASNGTFKVAAIGTVRGQSRKVTATIRRQSPLDYLYFTDYEARDPDTYVLGIDNYNAADAAKYCSMHYYEGRPSNCTDIYFITADYLNGPVHSNDAYLFSGTPHFLKAVTSSWNTTQTYKWRGDTACQTNMVTCFTASNPQGVVYKPALQLPSSSKWLKARTLSQYGGCLYSGPTRIVFKLDASQTPKMDVISPRTSSSSTNPGCGPGQNLTPPTNGVIYVQDVPTTASNYATICGSTATHPLLNGTPQNSTYTTSFLNPSDITVPNYGVCDGDAFVEGVVGGGVTVGTENNIIVTNNLTYKNASTSGYTDVLGLVANNWAEIYHPVNSSNANLTLPTDGNTALNDLTINAAILAVNHTFRLQNNTKGSALGTLTINGAFAQKYRGPVGTFSGSTIQSGYAKNYNYDARLAYLTPPAAMDPYTTSWRVINWKEATGG